MAPVLQMALLKFHKNFHDYRNEMTALKNIYLGINWLGHALLVTTNHRLGHVVYTVCVCGIRSDAMYMIWQAKPLCDVCLLHGYII